MGLVQKSFSDIITFSRSSNATRIGPTGLVEYAPHNLFQRSQEFDNAYWTKNGTSVSANSTASPNGTVTSDTLIESATTAPHFIESSATVTTIGTVMTVSVYAKAKERSVLQITFNGGDVSGNPRANFDISNGVLGSVDSGITPNISSIGNGWFRCSATVTAAAVIIAPIFCLVNSASAGRAASYTGDGTSGIYIWGAQLSVGPYALDYTPTTSAAVYGPRFDYDPVTLAARGLLVEESRTNLLTYSEDFSNAAWSKTNSTITANNATSPDGTVTADLISGSGVGQRIVQAITANGTQQTLSFFVKKPSSGVFSGASLLFYNNTTSVTIAYATFSGQTFTANATTGTATSTSYGNGWYRITLTNSSGLSVGNSVGCYLYPDNQGGGSSANDTLLAWGAQCE